MGVRPWGQLGGVLVGIEGMAVLAGGVSGVGDVGGRLVDDPAGGRGCYRRARWTSSTLSGQ
ncbi:MAG TPA: hypothetical protein VIU87_20725 [Mycobacterium sp.]